MKKSRTIRTFEPDPDVGELIEKASQAGLEITSIINESLRLVGPEIIDRLIDEKLKILQKLSFENPQLLLAGIAIAA